MRGGFSPPAPRGVRGGGEPPAREKSNQKKSRILLLKGRRKKTDVPPNAGRQPAFDGTSVFLRPDLDKNIFVFSDLTFPIMMKKWESMTWSKMGL